MAQRAIKTFTTDGIGRSYRVNFGDIFADAHPLVAAAPDRFEAVVEITASALDAPANVTVTNITASTADVSWDHVEGAGTYEVTTSPATNTYILDGNDVQLTGLASLTTYDVNVVARPGNFVNDDSAAGTANFTTT